MPLYQSSVLKKFLSAQDNNTIESAFAEYSSYFLDTKIQHNIRKSKEEQFQEGFLRELFVKILGYTINPEPNFNLTTELKNIKDAKKTDGAILKGDKALAVIELKGTDTKNLDKATDQAFNYKNNQPDCVYVITSNFEKLRFYINNAVEHEEFNLFNLTLDEFRILWLFLQKDNLLAGIPEKVKNESLLEEEKVTKRLYKDYSNFKNDLWNDLVEKNQQYDELTLYKKSQKLLDRFLFIFFAEDKGLLPPNRISGIIKEWSQLKDLDAYSPLYDRFKKHFEYINSGYKGPNYEIHAYNGGLFQEDDILDSVVIDDDLLKKHCSKLTEYDFDTEVDTNILGHIFEHSLNDIENVRAQLAGEDVDKSKTKRKKDGVFYTPKYITKYIVENTVGKLCEEKKTELGIDEEEFSKDRKGRRKDTLKKLDQQLKEYRKWLLEITICDPACGSGAFLNQALEFLISEHQYIDELESQLLGYGMVFPDVENHILEKNIYGVDINEESVEIARLSLWLRTAQKGRKLTSLSNNIKVGNSLIDDPKIAGELAFKWQEQFPMVFEKGGFDIVIGNPPYVKRQNISNPLIIRYLEEQYKSSTYNFDLYLLFLELGAQLINPNGILSFINPSKFTSTKTGQGIREYLDQNCHITEYIDFKEYQVFKDATTYCCIISLMNGPKGETVYREVNSSSPTEISSFNSRSILIKPSTSGLGWSFSQTIQITGDAKLKDYINTITGIESGADNIYILDRKDPRLKEMKASLDKIIFPTIKGSNVSRYYSDQQPYFSIIPFNEDGTLISISTLKEKHISVWTYLKSNEQVLRAREKNKMNHDNWHGFVYPKNLYKYNNDRIIWSDISIKPQFTIDSSKSWHVRTVCSLELNEVAISKDLTLKSLLALLNSNLFYYFIKSNSNSVRGGYFRYKPQYVKEFPINLNWGTQITAELESLVTLHLESSQNYHDLILKFSQLLISKFQFESQLGKKLQNWPHLDFKGFLGELKKQKIKLSLEEEAEWMAYFNKKKAEANSLQAEIDRIDNEIDQMVYELYGLSAEEIRIVEEATDK